MIPLLLALAPVLAINPRAVESTLELHGWGQPARDEALDRVASAVAERLAGDPDKVPPEGAYAQLRFVLEKERISDALVYPFTVRHRDPQAVTDRLPSLLARLDRQRPPTHYGLATHGRAEGLTTTVILVHRGFTLKQPLPRTMKSPARLSFRGELRSGYFRPRVLVAPPGGRAIRERPAWGEGQNVDVTLFFDDGPGRYGVELVADSQFGPVVLLNDQVYVDAEPPPLPVVPITAPTAATRPDRALWERINRARASRGVPPLIWHPTLANAARDHARELAASQQLSHLSPDSGWLETRLQSHPGRWKRVAENLAEAVDAEEALRAFMESPGHARNLLARHLTHVGVGVNGRFFAVAFAEVPE
ncbi:MAG: CAP domain-containing protein [Bradymonadia bacterium]